MADVLFSSGGLAPMQTNLKQLIPVGGLSVPVVTIATPLPPPAPKTTNIVREAKSHKASYANGALSGPPLE